MPRTCPPLTPEFHLLAACSWLAPAPLASFQAGQIQQATARVINWQAFLELVSRHRVAAVVTTNLRHHARDAVPPEWLARLAGKEAWASQRALGLAGDLARLGKILSDGGIEVLPLKGSLLSLRLFGHLGMRDVRDIDILVHPAEVWPADRLLRAAGYTSIFPDFELSERAKRAALGVAHHFIYQHHATHLLVELHWRLHHWTQQQIAQLWRQCGHWEWMSVLWKDLAPEHLLPLLCDHGARHQWSSIKWLGDVATLIAQTPEGLWDRVLSAARQFDVERPLAQAALLSSWIFSLPLPTPLIDLVAREKATPRLAAAALKYLLSANPYLIHSKNPFIRLPQLLLEFFLYNNRLRKRTSTVSEISQLAVCLEDFRGAPIPDRLFFLYYLRRPVFWVYRRLTQPSAY